ncbi:MAG: PKD domain-containing protein [Candidatus Thermoplasmatota archaeon]
MGKKKVLMIVAIMLCTSILLCPSGYSANRNLINETNHHQDFDVLRSGIQPTPYYFPFSNKNVQPAYTPTSSFNFPQYEFIQNPTPVLKSFYDYMPGSYSSNSICLQKMNGGGQYLTFHAQPTKTSERRQYYAYVNSSYGIINGTITTYTKRQGYGSLAIHPSTGNPIVSWHESPEYTTAITYDNFNAGNIPGSWMNPVTIPLSDSMHYIWPSMYIGPSPLGTQYVRVYQITNNEVNIPGGLPCEDVRIMYTDVLNTHDADLTSLLNQTSWTTTTVFTEWRAKACRPFQAFAIDYTHPGKVAFIGWASWLKGDMGDMPVNEGAFVWESFDYGETWNIANLYDDGPGQPLYQVQNPGFPEAPAFLDVTIAGFHNTALYDAEGNLHMPYLQQYSWSNGVSTFYLPYFLPQAEMVWNGTSFSFREVPQLPGYDSHSGHTVPWIDSNNLFPVIGWSTYPASDAGIFHENIQKQAINREKNWMVQMWVDGTYHQLGTDGNPQYSKYKKHPLIYISVSPDNGNSWFDPIPLTDVNSQLFDFSDQITVYPYVCPDIVDLGNDWGQIFLYYLDDNDFGSYIQSSGPNTGGYLTYCSIKIKFPKPGDMDINANGPYTGYIGDEINMFGSASGGKPPYVWHWDFGDGQTASVQNPKHSYNERGTYTVRLTVTDSSNPPNIKNDTTVATIQNRFTIQIKKGLGLKVFVNNTGDKDLTNISWSIKVNGRFVFPKEKKGMLSELLVGEEKTVQMLIFGFGPIGITVRIDKENMSEPALLVLFYVIDTKLNESKTTVTNLYDYKKNIEEKK